MFHKDDTARRQYDSYFVAVRLPDRQSWQTSRQSAGEILAGKVIAPSMYRWTPRHAGTQEQRKATRTRYLCILSALGAGVRSSIGLKVERTDSSEA